MLRNAQTLLFAFFALVALAGCEGKSGGGSNQNDGKQNIRDLYPELPPDPGEEGKKTLEGIDSNNNGVRDDVEIAIYESFPSRYQDEDRQVLLQSAKSRQETLTAAASGNIETILKAERESARAIECAFKKFPNSMKSVELIDFATQKVVNTKARVQAYSSFSAALSGRSFSGSGDPIPCDVDKAKEAMALSAFSARSYSFNPNLPPDPKEEGKKTLAGIDSNNNGVRDDVEIAIYNYAPRADQIELRSALEQYAKVIQSKFAINPYNENAVIEVFRNQLRGSECLKLKSVRTDRADQDFIIKSVVNTPQRKRMSDLYQTTLIKSKNATFFDSGDPIPCDYDKK
ncbi:MAG: hypothetical protein LBF86_01680 [Helicobacteraceae bacterium]|nr:hypothetical protein [Helicobacteraceae bacterium]